MGRLHVSQFILFAVAASLRVLASASRPAMNTSHAYHTLSLRLLVMKPTPEPIEGIILDNSVSSVAKKTLSVSTYQLGLIRNNEKR